MPAGCNPGFNPQLALLHTESWTRTPRGPFQPGLALCFHMTVAVQPQIDQPLQNSEALRSQFLLRAEGQDFSLMETQNISPGVQGKEQSAPNQPGNSTSE